MMNNGDIVAQFNLFKGMTSNFIAEAEKAGFILDAKEKATASLVVVDAAELLFKSAMLPVELLPEFVNENQEMIVAKALELLDAHFIAEQEKRAEEDLTFHPEHIQAHAIEDEGGTWSQELVKGGKWHSLPEELKSHLNNYHGEYKVSHVHVDNFEDPLAFTKSIDTEEIIPSYIHEVAHRLDEFAITGESPNDEQIAQFEDLYRADIVPNMVDAAGGIISEEMAEHLNKAHGVDKFGNLRFEPHPLEIGMIGPSSLYIRKLEFAKAGETKEVTPGPLDSIREFLYKAIPGQVIPGGSMEDPEAMYGADLSGGEDPYAAEQAAMEMEPPVEGMESAIQDPGEAAALSVPVHQNAQSLVDRFKAMGLFGGKQVPPAGGGFPTPQGFGDGHKAPGLGGPDPLASSEGKESKSWANGSAIGKGSTAFQKAIADFRRGE